MKHNCLEERRKENMLRKGFDESSLCTSWSSSELFSSGLSTPFGSELGSTETESEGEDFLAELTRQMANYMLDDDDEEESRAENCVSDQPEACGAAAKWSAGCNSTSTYYCDERFMRTSTEPTATPITTGINYYSQTCAEGQMQPVEVYQLNNQPSIKEDKYLRLGKRTEMMSELVEQSKLQQLQQQQYKGQSQNRQDQVRGGHGGNSLPSPNGSGIRAVFLRGSGSRTRSGGTGVFLPRVIDNQTKPKKRTGCSTVLIPARVLQALESHFNKMDALSQSNGCGGFTNRTRRGDTMEQKRESRLETRPASNNQEMQLPEDWTY